MLLMANVDDVSGELISHVIDELMARGANSVHVVHAITKKGRPEHLFWVDVNQENVEIVAHTLALELGTLGVRVFDPQHISFAYRFCQVRVRSSDRPGKDALVLVKQMIDQEGQVMSVKAEMDELRAAWRDLAPEGCRFSLKAMRRLVEQVVQDRISRSWNGIEVEYLGGADDEKDPTSTG